MDISNKKLGNNWEKEYAEILSKKGYWVTFLTPHKNTGAQPCDLVAIKNNIGKLIDCKTCATHLFPIKRIEENQRQCFKKYSKCGNTDFILAINNYVLENNINKEINNEEKSKKSSSKKSDKIDTKIITYNMYKEGKSIEEIAKERGFTKQTIEHHLLANFENGLDIDLEKNINMKYKSQVFKAIDEIGYDKLRPIKDMVPADVTYLDIGYFVILYKKEKNS